ncbi:hypothetical protein B9D94_19970 [Paenibacillus sp. Cedars]|nr:hypothetical protein B9D94_19970 [Paenibacillus sp. Cedars]
MSNKGVICKNKLYVKFEFKSYIIFWKLETFSINLEVFSMYGMYILFIILIIVGVTPTFYRLNKRINL